MLRVAPPKARMVFCEDALWTGTEMRNLLRRFASSGDLRAIHGERTILLRHCLVSDYGIWACRHFMEYAKLKNVDLLLDGRQRFVRVLRSDLSDDEVKCQWHLSPEEFDAWLSRQVTPHAFYGNKNLWGGRESEALNICKELGSQLIERYVTATGRSWSDDVKEAFALGAGSFGCAVVFAHSVPKACLPIFWLGGEIKFSGASLNWKPLFFDARRLKKLASVS